MDTVGKTSDPEILIQETDPQSRPIVITIFTLVVYPYFCLYVRPLFKISQDNFQVKIVIATGWRDCGLGHVDNY